MEISAGGLCAPGTNRVLVRYVGICLPDDSSRKGVFESVYVEYVERDGHKNIDFQSESLNLAMRSKGK